MGEVSSRGAFGDVNGRGSGSDEGGTRRRPENSPETVKERKERRWREAIGEEIVAGDGQTCKVCEGVVPFAL